MWFISNIHVRQEVGVAACDWSVLCMFLLSLFEMSEQLLSDVSLHFQDNGGEAVNGVTEPSPPGSPGASRKGKMSQAATLPTKTQKVSTSQLEGFLHRKHEWEGHNKKASNR